jgi:hypothetical protein
MTPWRRGKIILTWDASPLGDGFATPSFADECFKLRGKRPRDEEEVTVSVSPDGKIVEINGC